MATVLGVCLLMAEFGKIHRVYLFRWEVSVCTQLYTYLWLVAYYIQKAGFFQILLPTTLTTALLVLFHCTCDAIHRSFY